MGSIGANILEADGALTKKDFINKIAIARREANESKHWLVLIKRTEKINITADRKEIDYLIKEVGEPTLILSSIIDNTKRG